MRKRKRLLLLKHCVLCIPVIDDAVGRRTHLSDVHFSVDVRRRLRVTEQVQTHTGSVCSHHVRVTWRGHVESDGVRALEVSRPGGQWGNHWTWSHCQVGRGRRWSVQRGSSAIDADASRNIETVRRVPQRVGCSSKCSSSSCCCCCFCCCNKACWLE